MMSGHTKWVPRSERKSRAEIAELLRNSPGEVMLVESFPRERTQAARDLGTSIRRGILRDFRPAESFDAQSHIEGDAVNVYACYVGEDGGHQPDPEAWQ